MSNKLITSCQDCVFAEYADDEQYGCVAGQLEHYPDKIEAYNELGKFYVIPDICSFNRPKHWAGEEKDMTKLKEKIVKESQITYNAFVFAIGKTDKEIFQTLNSLLDQTNQPAKIVLCVNIMSPIRMAALMPTLNKFKSWQIEDQYDSEKKTDYFYRSVAHHSNRWFMAINAGCIVSTNWVQQTNLSLISGRSEALAYVYPEDKPQMILGPSHLSGEILTKLGNFFDA